MGAFTGGVLTTKRLLILVLLDAIAVLVFVLHFRKDPSYVPLVIGLLPSILCNIIYVNEVVVAAGKAKETSPEDNEMRRRKQSALPLLIMPILYCIMLPSLIKFYGSLGWSPGVCVGFSVLLCLALISSYGGIKLLFNR